MKNCLLCGQPFSGKRKDALYCSGTCKAKYSELKKNKGLSGLQLQAEQDAMGDKPTENPPYANTVDAIDLEPFANILGGFDEVNPDTTGLNQENNSTELNTGDQGKVDNQQAEDEELEAIMPSQYVTREVKRPSLLYQYLQSELAACRNDLKRCEAEIARINNLIMEEGNRSGAGYLMTGAGIGFGLPLAYNYWKNNEAPALIEPTKLQDKNGKPISFISNKNRQVKNTKKPAPKKPTEENKTGFSFWEIFFMGLAGTGVGYLSKSATEADREAEKAKNIQGYQSLLKELAPIYHTLKEIEAHILKEMQNTPAYSIEEVQVVNPMYTIVQSKIEEEERKKRKNQHRNDTSQNNTMDDNKDLSGFSDEENTSELNEIKNSNNNSKKGRNLETDKIFSMKNVSKLKHPVLDFTGKWLDFFGQPQTNFFCVIHGMSGEGKSHFAMQFGKYLAERFGNVLYISGEEGFANTFQQKIEALGASVDRYYASEIKTGEGILKDVPNQYHFIIIDSLNNMGIDTELMRAIRNQYKQSGIIAICQSTKDGKIRGSYEIVHDSDMAVKVVNGIATTTKNRFKEKHQDFNVFAVYEKKVKPNLLLDKKKSEDKTLDQDFDNTL